MRTGTVPRVTAMASWRRDPLAVAYDGRARRVLLGAIASRTRGGRGVQVFVSSPAAEFRRPLGNGRTAHEQAFKQALYYPVTQVPRQIARARGLGTEGAVYEWSLRVRWGKIENRRGRWGRTAHVRIYAYRAGLRYSMRHPERSFAARPELRSTAAPDRAS